MGTPRITRRRVLKTAGVASIAGAVGALGATVATAADPNATYRWDLVNLGLPPPLCVEPGGTASARARDGSRITMTGSGTFRDTPGLPQNVTGGGTWTIVGGPQAGSGTYRVTGYDGFDLAFGSLPIPDCIAPAETARAGLVRLRIRYNDGDEGTLHVSCRLPNSPAVMAEGISATKDHVAYWCNDEPVDGAEGNRTLFHQIK